MFHDKVIRVQRMQNVGRTKYLQEYFTVHMRPKNLKILSSLLETVKDEAESSKQSQDFHDSRD